MVAIGSETALSERVLGLNDRNTWKILKKFLLQNHLVKMLETGFEALSSGP